MSLNVFRPRNLIIAARSLRSWRGLGISLISIVSTILLVTLVSYVVERSVYLDVRTGTVLVSNTIQPHEGMVLPQAVLVTESGITEIPQGAELFFGHGSTIRIKRPRLSGLLEIEFLATEQAGAEVLQQPFLRTDVNVALTEGLKVVIAPDNVARMAPLELVGTIELGGFAGPTNPDYLFEGSFVFNERFLTSPTTSGGTETRSGELRAATSISITDADGSPLSSRIMIEPNSFSTDRTFDHKMMRVFSTTGSGEGLPQLQVARQSHLNPTSIRPRWTDRVLSNPWVIGITSALAFVLVVIELGLALLRGFSRNR